MEVNILAVRAEDERAFAAYEAALVGNDVAALTALSWDDPLRNHPSAVLPKKESLNADEGRRTRDARR